jgi:hypothetical protein
MAGNSHVADCGKDETKCKVLISCCCFYKLKKDSSIRKSVALKKMVRFTNRACRDLGKIISWEQGKP